MPDRPLILIVDDDPAVLGSLTFVLESHQFAVRACPSARAARLARAEEAACMVIDQLLPDMTGLDLLRALRAEGVKTPAILITTAPSAAIQRQAALEGVAIVPKPLLSDELFVRIRSLIGDPDRG